MSELQKLFSAFLDYSDAFKGNTPRTIKWYRDTFRRFIKMTGAEALSDFNKINIEHCIYSGRQQHNWSAKTIKNFILVFSLFADWLVEKDYIDHNPTKDMPRPKIPKTLPRSLTKEQAEEILTWTENIRHHFQYDRIRAMAIISTFLFTGIRLAELVNLQMKDIDLTEQHVYVRQGKGLKDRFIPMNERLLIVLKRYLHQRDIKGKECPYLFTGTNTDNKLCEKHIPNLIKKIRSKSGIYFSAHTLRHTFATLMLQAGCDIYTLSKLMGHSDIKTTTIYLLVTDTDMKQKVSMHPLNARANQFFESSPLNSSD